MLSRIFILRCGFSFKHSFLLPIFAYAAYFRGIPINRLTRKKQKKNNFPSRLPAAFLFKKKAFYHFFLFF